MRSVTLTVFSLLAFSCVLAHAADEDVATCYRNAKKQSETHSCMVMELRSVQASYNDVIERVLTEARIVDRMNKKKRATKAFTDANKSFDAFVRSECAFRDIGKGFEVENSEASLACKINLLRLRKSSLQIEFLAPK